VFCIGIKTCRNSMDFVIFHRCWSEWLSIRIAQKDNCTVGSSRIVKFLSDRKIHMGGGAGVGRSQSAPFLKHLPTLRCNVVYNRFVATKATVLDIGGTCSVRLQSCCT
jgi:hypothetical protein